MTFEYEEKEIDPYDLVKDIDAPRLIRDRLNIPLDFYEHPEKITDIDTKRIAEYRMIVGERIMEMFESILTEFRGMLEAKEKEINPWSSESILVLDDFIAREDYLKKKLEEAGLLSDINSTSDIYEYYFSRGGMVESLYELIIAKGLVLLAVEGGYLSEGEEVENAFKLLPPNADTLSSIFLKKLHAQQQHAISFFREKFDAEKRKKLGILFSVGFVVSKGIIRSGVKESFTHEDLLKLVSELDEKTQMKPIMDEYFEMLLMRRGSTEQELPQSLRSRVVNKLAGTQESFYEDRSPRCDVTHGYLMRVILDGFREKQNTTSPSL